MTHLIELYTLQPILRAEILRLDKSAPTPHYKHYRNYFRPAII